MKKMIIMLVVLAQAVAFAQQADSGTGDVGSVGGDTVTLSQQAGALGQIADRNLAGDEATELLRSVLSGQSYEARVSLLRTQCAKDPNGSAESFICSVGIGIDDLEDDDRGWGTVMSLEYKIDSRSGVVSEAALTMVAG